jgi:transglutaminase-like putative cysteine protease
MRLHIRHRTVYRYESPADYAAQILRMTPRPYEGMNVLSWGVTPDAGTTAAEAFGRERGWVGLDPANGSCPGERHVRTSVGLDYASAAPVRGMRRGRGYETLQVGVQVARLAEQ